MTEVFDARLKSEQMLDEIKQHHRSKDVVDVDEERIKVVVFTVAGNRYAFHGEDIREILPAGEISWVPGIPDYLLGLINVRGDIESVIDIRQFLGSGRLETSNGLIALAIQGDFRSGIFIDTIEDVMDVPCSALHSPLSTLDGAVRELVIGELHHDGVIIPLLDIGKLAAKITL